jgi:hypothetical protein
LISPRNDWKTGDISFTKFTGVKQDILLKKKVILLSGPQRER